LKEPIMPTAVAIFDETTAGERTPALTLDVLTEQITVRELIRSRVYQEVQDYNRRSPAFFRGLVQPSGATRTSSGFRLRDQHATIDWKEQFAHALEAFERNGFFILVDGRHVEDLDEEVTLRAGSEVSFVRLVPLIGG
jgi:hypothetical protein